jgi:hypothetical protein
MGIPSPDDSTFQWIMGISGTVVAGVFAFAFKRTQSVEDRLNHRIDAADDRIDKFRDEVRKEADAADDRLWQAVNANRAETQAHLNEILKTMATKDDVRELGRRIEAALAQRVTP